MGRFLKLFSKGDSCRLLVNLEGKHVSRYQFFKSLLEHNHACLSFIAGLEQMYYSGRPFSLVEVRKKVQDLSAELKALLADFDILSESKFSSLSGVYQRLQQELAQELSPMIAFSSQELVLTLEALTPEKRSLVGAKAGNLSAIKNDLQVPVPEGFAVTAVAYEKFIEENKLAKPIEIELSLFDPESLNGMEKIGTTLMTMILQASVPENIQKAILEAYDSLEERSGKDLRISMRSSAIGEDTEAGFAGQFQTVLNVRRENILEAFKTVLASKYSARALLYRYQQGFIDQLTPMGVAGIEMIDAKTSGVLYTRDPEDPESTHLKISSIWGLGEHLVDGSASPDQFLVDRETMEIKKKVTSRKDHRLISSPQGGTMLEEVPEQEKGMPSLSDDKVIQLAHYGLRLEKYFGSPQYIEWAMDQGDRLFILQSRPLNLPNRKPEQIEIRRDLPNHPILLSKGQVASPGIAAGPVYLLKEEGDLENIPQGSILVAKTASPNYARLMGKIKGIITDIGSITSHLASVAREFGIPAIFDTDKATSTLAHGDQVTLQGETTTVYKGIVEELVGNFQLPQNRIFESPVHHRLRTILDLISPLNLTDPHHPSFSPEGCRTFQDLVRFTHEQAVKEMFGLVDTAGSKSVAIRLKTNIPLVLYLLDLGGGLKEGLSTCDSINPDHIESIPMKAVWKGFTHPGITWAGSINFDMKKFMTLMAVAATSEFGETPGGDSYALLSRDYLNFSAKFGYHFATVDCLCGEYSSQNYIALQFAGGAGNYRGRSLRVIFLADILKKLGFEITIQGDLLEASLIGYNRRSMEEKLDQVGRLLACSRLLDMALNSQGDIQRLTDRFFKEEYDFLTGPQQERLEGFFVQTGEWKQSTEDGQTVFLQDGSKSGLFLFSGLVGAVSKVVGTSTQELLDNIEAYYYFPLAIAKNSEMADGMAQVQVKAIKGSIDRAGGLAFGIKNSGNYLVFRINALEDNVILFEYINNKRFQRASVKIKIDSNRWYGLKVEIKGPHLTGYADDEPVLEYEAQTPIKGHVGLWTKADSVTVLRELTYGGQKKI
ncbi:MAG: pyruvate, phosphate dikinase [Deltaproteobacteria bacterium]|nr:pyruvate, phosphate dikinase [Deltaproteobacteria bacterium]